jgi:predicted secreted protein
MARIEERVGLSGKVSWRVQVRLKGKRAQTATFSRENGRCAVGAAHRGRSAGRAASFLQ